MNTNDIYFIHGTDYKEMTVRILEAADLAGLIGDTDKSVALKPNLVTTTPPEDGATTHPEILDGALTYLQSRGFHNLTVMEGAWAGARTEDAFQVCYHDRICKAHDVPFFDTKKDSHTTHDAKGMDIAVCDHALAVDFMINLPVLKGHCQTKMTCALKNNKGIIPDFEKRRFHTLGLHKPIAHLNTVCRNDFILVDNICGDPDFEDGGNPVVMNRILAFRDPVLCDAFACETLGLLVDDVPYVRLAETLGVGNADVACAHRIYVNEPSDEQRQAGDVIRPSGQVKRLLQHAEPKDACSACIGALIRALQQMERRGTLRNLNKTVCIGQGYREEGDATAASSCLGIGRCTASFVRTLPGCPPTASEIVRFLEGIN